MSSRGNDGAITFRDWHPVGVEEYGYAAPDPLDPDLVYGGNNVTRYDRRTGQVSDVGPIGGARRPAARSARCARSRSSFPPPSRTCSISATTPVEDRGRRPHWEPSART